MITPSPQRNLGNARQYFREHLRVGDYYSERNAVEGVWYGEGARRLGLEGGVGEAAFLALCDGRNPATGATLTLRRNTTRQSDGVEKVNRRVFYDFVYRPPKSVSLLALMEDPRIVDLHRKAVRASLAVLESYAGTRVRRDGACEDRRTGNVVAALFEHDTSREQDPLLHTHAILFNATWDNVESRWKALQTRDMFRVLAYANAVYDTEITRELVRLGYSIQPVGRSWEIAGVSRAMIQTLSKRRSQIERRLAEELAKPGNAGLDPHTLRDRIARDERRRKIRHADRSALLQTWRAELGPDGVRTLVRLHPPASFRSLLPRPDYAAALAWGKSLVFERKSVVHLHELLAAASRRLLGTDATMPQLLATARASGLVREKDGERVTSVEGLRREWGIVERARSVSKLPLELDSDRSLPSLKSTQELPKPALVKWHALRREKRILRSLPLFQRVADGMSKPSGRKISH